MRVGWTEWGRIVEADDVERCGWALRYHLEPVGGMLYALEVLVRENPPRIMAYLKEELEKVSDVKVRWYGLLMIACGVLNKVLVEEILRKVDYSGDELIDPLWEVCRRGDVDIVKVLISHGANVNGFEQGSWEREYQMEHNIGLSSHAKRFLLRDPLDRGYGERPLAAALNGGYIEVMKVLLSHGADVNVVSRDGWRPLDEGAEDGHVEIVEILLSHGADVNGVGSFGSALSIAARENHRDVVDLLISEGARLPPNDDIDHTAFIIDEIY